MSDDGIRKESQRYNINYSLDVNKGNMIKSVW
jgi:hypothetical protein